MTAREFGTRVKELTEEYGLDRNDTMLYVSVPKDDDVMSDIGARATVFPITNVSVTEKNDLFFTIGSRPYFGRSMTMLQVRNATNALSKKYRLTYDETMVQFPGGLGVYRIDVDPRKNIRIELADENMLKEGLKEITFAALVAGLMAVQGICSERKLTTELDKVKSVASLNVNSPEVRKAVENSLLNKKSFGGLNSLNMINALAKTLWDEARGEKEIGRRAVMSVIWNRAEEKPENLKNVISKPAQFSKWNSYKGGWTDDTYLFFVPNEILKTSKDYSTISVTVWDDCVNIATEAVMGKFKSTIGNMNSYLNKDKASKKALNSWGKDCKLKIGSHHFGYVKTNDPKNGAGAKVKKPVVYVVKSGDTLSKIAKVSGKTIQELMTLNPKITDPAKIFIGQKIRV